MILAVDTHYANQSAVTAGILFKDISDTAHLSTHVVNSVGPPAAYQPGAFYKRELPEILRLLDTLPCQPDIILIDGYCELDTSGAPGLGHFLFEALNQTIDIIGVAKSAYKGSPHAEQVFRGVSKVPLYVTSSGGISQYDAAKMIRNMHGAFRIPDLLKQVDQLCRGIAP